MYGSTSSSDTILKDATGVEPGCVEIIPRNLVTLHVRTWLYSLHTDTRNFSDKVTCNNSKCVIHTHPCWYILLGQKSNWNEKYQILMPLNIQSMVCRDAMSCNMISFQSLLVTWCTSRFNIQQLYALPTLYLCVLYLSENKQRLVPLTA